MSSRNNVEELGESKYEANSNMKVFNKIGDENVDGGVHNNEIVNSQCNIRSDVEIELEQINDDYNHNVDERENNNGDNIEPKITSMISNDDNFKEIDITDESKSKDNFQKENLEIISTQEDRGTNKKKSFSDWSRSTFTFAKQIVSESLGFSSKTVDKEIEKLITNLLESKVQCNKLISKAQNITKALLALSAADKEFGMFLSEYSLKELVEYKQEMACTGECFRYMQKNTSLLEDVLNMFVANMSTLSTKTIEDALLSVRQYDACRIEYDAHRIEYEQTVKMASKDEDKIKATEAKYKEYILKYNKARADITVKIKLVEENKVKVIKRNLMILHNALLKYSKEAVESLSEISSQYEFKPLSSDSWLETTD